MSEHVGKALVLGGVKSGKSRYAESLVQKVSTRVSVIVTAQALDDEMKRRIARHQADRPNTWLVYEQPLMLGQQLRDLAQGESAAGTMAGAKTEVILIDCLTLWLSNLLMLNDAAMMKAQVEDFVAAVKECSTPLVMVSNETNMGIVPLGEVSRRYCDEVGLLHQRLATVCDRVDLLVAGLPLNVKPGS